MTDRDKEIKALRPTIALSIKGHKNKLEAFMHETLRPVLKFQHDRIVAFIQNEKHLKSDYLAQKNAEEQHQYLTQYISKNNVLRATLIGCISGLMTSEEFAFYLKNKKELDRRIIEMTVVRFLSVQ